MKKLILSLLFAMAAPAIAQVPLKNVQQKVADKSLVDNIVVPAGITITVASGANITNNGTATGFGEGTVTSVGLSMPAIFGISGSPVTTSGSLTATLVPQAAHKVLAGPTTGSDATPDFRLLVSSDIPDLSTIYQPLLTLGSGVQDALAVNIGSAGAPVLYNGAGGTPSSMNGSNISSLNASNISSGALALERISGAGASDGNLMCFSDPNWIPVATSALNVGSATKLFTPRTINGVAFDGSADITVTAAGSTLSDNVPVSKLDVASQAEAEAGTSTAKVMTPQRTAQAIAALASGGGAHTDVQKFTANGTWTKPAGAVSIDLVIIGGGAGGSSGARGPNGANRFGGSGGGPGKCVYLNHVSPSTFGSTEAVVVGSGGTGAAGITTDGTNGQVGTAGGDSSFGPWKAAGGAAPTSFSTSAPAVTNSCYLFNTIAASGASAGAGATPAAITALAPTGGGGGTTLSSSNQASFSGPGGGYTTSFSSGGLYTGTVATGGALGAKSSVGTPTNGGDGSSVMLLSGTGGGGGGGAQPTISGGVSANGANGGDGGLYGGGGGGGAASEDGFTSGAGGNGGDGVVIIITHF